MTKTSLFIIFLLFTAVLSTKITVGDDIGKCDPAVGDISDRLAIPLTMKASFCISNVVSGYTVGISLSNVAYGNNYKILASLQPFPNVNTAQWIGSTELVIETSLETHTGSKPFYFTIVKDSEEPIQPDEGALQAYASFAVDFSRTLSATVSETSYFHIKHCTQGRFYAEITASEGSISAVYVSHATGRPSEENSIIKKEAAPFVIDEYIEVAGLYFIAVVPTDGNTMVHVKSERQIATVLQADLNITSTLYEYCEQTYEFDLRDWKRQSDFRVYVQSFDPHLSPKFFFAFDGGYPTFDSHDLAFSTKRSGSIVVPNAFFSDSDSIRFTVAGDRNLSPFYGSSYLLVVSSDLVALERGRFSSFEMKNDAVVHGIVEIQNWAPNAYLALDVYDVKDVPASSISVYMSTTDVFVSHRTADKETKGDMLFELGDEDMYYFGFKIDGTVASKSVPVSYDIVYELPIEKLNDITIDDNALSHYVFVIPDGYDESMRLSWEANDISTVFDVYVSGTDPLPNARSHQFSSINLDADDFMVIPQALYSENRQIYVGVHALSDQPVTGSLIVTLASEPLIKPNQLVHDLVGGNDACKSYSFYTSSHPVIAVVDSDRDLVLNMSCNSFAFRASVGQTVYYDETLFGKLDPSTLCHVSVCSVTNAVQQIPFTLYIDEIDLLFEGRYKPAVVKEYSAFNVYNIESQDIFDDVTIELLPKSGVFSSSGPFDVYAAIGYLPTPVNHDYKMENVIAGEGSKFLKIPHAASTLQNEVGSLFYTVFAHGKLNLYQTRVLVNQYLNSISSHVRLELMGGQSAFFSTMAVKNRLAIDIKSKHTDDVDVFLSTVDPHPSYDNAEQRCEGKQRCEFIVVENTNYYLTVTTATTNEIEIGVFSPNSGVGRGWWVVIVLLLVFIGVIIYLMRGNIREWLSKRNYSSV
ncbi:hypothetical protein PCE1_002654 [Barthelona sp. PCE]